VIADKSSDQPRASGPDSSLEERAVNDIVAAFEAQLPGIVNYLADLIGRAAPRIKAGEKQLLFSQTRSECVQGQNLSGLRSSTHGGVEVRWREKK
jgi:hypothetical protein